MQTLSPQDAQALRAFGFRAVSYRVVLLVLLRFVTNINRYVVARQLSVLFRRVPRLLGANDFHVVRSLYQAMRSFDRFDVCPYLSRSSAFAVVCLRTMLTHCSLYLCRFWQCSVLRRSRNRRW
jgi:hypothetical protein